MLRGYQAGKSGVLLKAAKGGHRKGEVSSSMRASEGASEKGKRRAEREKRGEKEGGRGSSDGDGDDRFGLLEEGVERHYLSWCMV